MKTSYRMAALAVVVAFAAPASAGLIQPGQWTMTTKLSDVTLPGAPPQMTEMMAKPKTSNVCITPEQANRDPRDIFKSSQGKCKYSKFSIVGGTMSSVMTCEGGASGKMTIVSAGKLSPTAYTIRAVMRGTSPKGAMRMVSDMTARRTGACK